MDLAETPDVALPRMRAEAFAIDVIGGNRSATSAPAWVFSRRVSDSGRRGLIGARPSGQPRASPAQGKT